MLKIFMTGGAGFLGRALLSAFAEKGHTFTVYSRDESKHSIARRRWPYHRYILGDVRDVNRLETAMAGHDIVIHAAAMKFVPEAEHNVFEAIAVNLEGSLNVARVANRVGIKRVVGISTDKACDPVNVYGLTKRMMERAFQEANAWGGCEYSVVRYGNVIGSTGSVIPMFRRMIREGQTVGLTDPGMTRFWLSHGQAVDLVSSALTSPAGTILVPQAKAQTLLDTLKAIALVETGKETIDHKVIGLRPGEKLHEFLLSPSEAHLSRTEEGRFLVTDKTTEERRRPATDGYGSHDAPRISVAEMATMIREADGV